ncbi:hypothetical protein BaRGS_00000773, partial [Batillaria attramentaria]
GEQPHHCHKAGQLSVSRARTLLIINWATSGATNEVRGSRVRVSPFCEARLGRFP